MRNERVSAFFFSFFRKSDEIQREAYEFSCGIELKLGWRVLSAITFLTI